MTEAFKQQIETEARQAVTELLAQAGLRKGDVFVVGCSSSEIVGGSGGQYKPNDPIKRSEACVIFTRIAVASMRDSKAN